MKQRACVIPAALAGALACASVHAETLYVIDQLIVSVSSTADESGERVASLHSGDSVEVLELHDAYAHVRLASGTEGWIKASYLSPELPLQKKLTLEAQELERLKGENARLQAEATAVKAPVPAARALPADPPPAPTEQPVGWRAIWPWALACSALLAGFVLGWRMLDRRIRRKYGGLRIY